MNLLGLIPARGGSRGIPRKNLVPLAGRPLIAYSCDAALRSGRLTRVIASTDDPEIAAVARGCGVEVPFMRPPEIATDTTPMVDVVRHATAACAQDGWLTDAVVLLQPTSPLRRAEHIDRAVELYLDSGADTVVSVVRVPHRYTPSSLMRIGEDGSLSPLEGEPVVSRRQDKPTLFARNGPAVLVVGGRTLARRRLYGDVVRPLEMCEGDSVDIDGPDDLELAEFWLARGTLGARAPGSGQAPGAMPTSRS